MNRLNTLQVLLLGVSAVLTACVTSDPVRVNDDFGNSVRAMVQGQIYDPRAAQRPAANAPGGMDGAQGEAVLKKHREHVGNPGDVSKDVEIKVTR